MNWYVLESICIYITINNQIIPKNLCFEYKVVFLTSWSKTKKDNWSKLASLSYTYSYFNFVVGPYLYVC